MRLFLDTANQEQINSCKNYVEGVTSNPLILKKENINRNGFYERNKDLFRYIFMQVNSIDQVNAIGVHDNIIFKVPMIKENITLIKEIRAKGARVCATTVYDIFQFNMACELECEFSIAMHHKNADDHFVKKCVYVKAEREYKTEIIAASFRTKKEVEDVIIIGADCATIPPKLLLDCFFNKNTDTDCSQFDECDPIL